MTSSVAQDPSVYRGYIVSVVSEDVPGHTPVPAGCAAVPGPFGSTLEEAQANAAEQNASRGLSPDDVLEIRLSSMRASNII